MVKWFAKTTNYNKLQSYLLTVTLWNARFIEFTQRARRLGAMPPTSVAASLSTWSRTMVLVLTLGST